MRLSIALDDDLHRVAKAFAQAEGISLSRAVNVLLRRALEPQQAPPGQQGALSDFPVSPSAPLTAEEAQRAEDDEDERVA